MTLTTTLLHGDCLEVMKSSGLQGTGYRIRKSKIKT